MHMRMHMQMQMHVCMCMRMCMYVYVHVHVQVRFGAVVENVIFDADTREIDYNDVSITENTRCAYPLQARVGVGLGLGYFPLQARVGLGLGLGLG